MIKIKPEIKIFVLKAYFHLAADWRKTRYKIPQTKITFKTNTNKFITNERMFSLPTMLRTITILETWLIITIFKYNATINCSDMIETVFLSYFF